MKTLRDDDRLRDTFQALRKETARSGGVPEFDGMLAEAKRRAEQRPALEVFAGHASRKGRPTRRRLVQIGAWGSVALAAGVAALILVNRPPTGDAEFERLVAAYASETAAGSWSSPTSALLEVPGMDLLRSVPSIGAPLRGIDPSSLLRPQSPEEENL